MNENDKSRSGLQTAVDFAHAARTAKRIMQAAAASGVHGAAAATAREAFPLLLKVLIAVLVVFIAVPMVIFTALPNIFFGYNSSGTDTVIQMTQQAMTLGGVYMTLGNFEGAQIDSVVTGIAAEYEKNGTTIDHIVVSSAMTDDDLLWVIAINSAAHQQDLNTMSADLIRDFCKSSFTFLICVRIKQAKRGNDLQFKACSLYSRQQFFCCPCREVWISNYRLANRGLLNITSMAQR